MKCTSLLKHYETNNIHIYNLNNNNRLLNMKYITHIIIILALAYLIGLIIGMAGKISEVDNTEPLKQIIFKYDAELDQCEVDRDNFEFTVDSMSKTY